MRKNHHKLSEEHDEAMETIDFLEYQVGQLQFGDEEDFNEYMEEMDDDDEEDMDEE